MILQGFGERGGIATCEACSIKSERETEGILQKAVVGQEGKDIPRWGGGGGLPSRFFYFSTCTFSPPDIFRLGNNNKISCDFKQGGHPCTIMRFPKNCKKNNFVSSRLLYKYNTLSCIEFKFLRTGIV
jgi:hypothetical protein